MRDDAAPIGRPMLSTMAAENPKLAPMGLGDEHRFAALVAQMSDEQFAGFLDLIRADLVASALPYQASLRGGLAAVSETDRATRFLPASDPQ